MYPFGLKLRIDARREFGGKKWNNTERKFPTKPGNDIYKQNMLHHGLREDSQFALTSVYARIICKNLHNQTT